jgi:hypothetical protein
MSGPTEVGQALCAGFETIRRTEIEQHAHEPALRSLVRLFALDPVSPVHSRWVQPS